MKTLHIYCDGGFGNRLNGLLAGLVLAEAGGWNPLIWWPRNNWCGAAFAEIFENKELPIIERELKTYVEEKDRLHFFMTEDHLQTGVPNRSPLEIPSLTEALAYLNSDPRDIFLHTPLIPPYCDLGVVCRKINTLRFQEKILGSVEQFLKSRHLQKPFFGLQIRKTDFGPNGAKEDELFELVQKCPDKRFFVCSDNSEVEAKFQTLPNAVSYPKQAYVEKLVEGDWNALAMDHSGRVYPFNVNRSAQSVVDAVVDLLILSHSQVVKTSNSTFLNAALLIQTARESVRVTPPAGVETTHPSKTAWNRTVETFCQWHLGDNLLHLHFLRKLSHAYPDVAFRHALHPQYIAQCQELVQDVPAIQLVPLGEAQFSQPIDAWKGADNFFFTHPRRFEFGHLYLDFFSTIAKKMGLQSPLRSKEEMLFDYPALQNRVLDRDYDFLVVNSVPLSGQFKVYTEEGFRSILERISAAGFSLITTKKVEGFDCTLDSHLSVTGIGNVSLYSHFLVAVCTGSMWPSINQFNNFRHERKVILNDHETVDFGRNVYMARTMEEAAAEVDLLCTKYQPLRRNPVARVTPR